VPNALLFRCSTRGEHPYNIAALLIIRDGCLLGHWGILGNRYLSIGGFWGELLPK